MVTLFTNMWNSAAEHFTICCSSFFFRKQKGALKSVFPLIVLGLVRLITTTGVDYQVSSFVGFSITLIY